MNNTTVERDFEKGLDFFKMVIEVCEEFDKNYTFVCPICGGEAHAQKTSYNGHHWGGCNNCGVSVME